MLDYIGNKLSDDVQNEGDKATKRGMARSEIAFPYVSLEDAVAVTRIIHDNGAALSRGQIAGFLRLKTADLRILGAKLFGLVTESSDGKVALTDLGVSILSHDEREARIARRDAFLKVPLYKKTYEAFQNRNLPARPLGLENAFVEFGVAPKQKDKARQAFERSASFAGYFEANKDRLIEPVILSRAGELLQKIKAAEAKPDPPNRGNHTDIHALDEPLIHGMLNRLPKPGDVWPLEDRKKWADALLVMFSIVYKE